MHDHPFNEFGAGRIVVGPIDVTAGTTGEHVHVMTAGHEPTGVLADAPLGPSRHVDAVALHHEQQTHQINRSRATRKA